MTQRPSTADRVSVGMPVYNGEKLLSRSIESILAQRYADLEVIVIDNASVDATEAIGRDYAARDARVRYVRNDQNIGAAANFTKCVELATGQYFMWAAYDDWWHPDFVVRLKQLLDEHPECGVAMCSVTRKFVDGVEFDTIAFKGDAHITGMSHDDVFCRMLKIVKSPPLHIFIYGLFRTHILRKLLDRPWPRSVAEDRVLMSELALMTRFCSCPDVLHVRTVYKEDLATRYPGSIHAITWSRRFRFARYALTLLSRIASSPHVPFGRKLRAVPCWARLVWSRRRVWLGELLGSR